MMLDGANATATRRAQHHGTGEPATRPVPKPRGVARQLVDGRIDESGELNLRHGAETLHGEADRNAGDRRFGERSVEHALAAEALQEPAGGANHAAIGGYVLAEDKDARVLLHGASERQIDSLDEADLAHRASLCSRCAARSAGSVA